MKKYLVQINLGGLVFKKKMVDAQNAESALEILMQDVTSLERNKISRIVIQEHK